MPIQSFFRNRGDGTFDVTRRSQVSGALHTKILPITEDQVWKWNSPGKPLVQNCFPQLSPADREFILTGVTQEEWDDLFKGPG